MNTREGIDRSPVSHFVRNASLLEEVFGTWPSFHDAEVLSVQLDRTGEQAPILETLIHVFEMTTDLDSSGRYVLKNNTMVRFRFTRIALEMLRWFNRQNVLWDLAIERMESPSPEGQELEIEFSSSYGLEAVFQCQTAEIVSVTPYEMRGDQ